LAAIRPQCSICSAAKALKSIKNHRICAVFWRMPICKTLSRRRSHHAIGKNEKRDKIMTTRRLRRVAASAYLLEKWGISRAPGTLAKLAVSGAGPRFQHDGRIPLYPEEELDIWASAILSPLRRSTSDAECEASADSASDGHVVRMQLASEGR
jgi:hypothetical protein